MCKEWPGARCAGHTGDQYASKEVKTREILAELMDAERALSSAHADPNVSAAELSALQTRALQLTSELGDAQAQQQEAKEIWASTPGGNSELNTQYARALEHGNGETAQALLETIHAGEEIREYRLEAQRVAADAYRNSVNASEEVKASVAQKTERLVEVQQHLAEAHKGISVASDSLDRAKKDEVTAHSSTRRAVNTVKSAQERMKGIVTDAYEQAGVPGGLAEHYATDTIATSQQGWHYLSSEQGDKFPNYTTEMEVKLKSSSPETYEAARALSESKKFHTAQTRLNSAVDNYNVSVGTLKEKKDVTYAASHSLQETVQKVEPESDEATSLKEDIIETKSLTSSGLADKETYAVGFSGFVKSSYKNQDGSSNAYVRVEDVGGKIPSYVQVDKVVRSGNNPHVVLKNGITVSVPDMKRSTIKLLSPEKGASKLIG